jgi:hypothetical protein
MFGIARQPKPRSPAPGPGLLAGALAAALAATAAPRIESPQPTYEFGWRDSAETLTNRFVLRNAGDGTLLISEIRTSCGCSRAEPQRRALGPGEETALDVQTSLRGLQGQIRKSVTVVSNDPDTPYLALWIAGEARAAVCLEPPNISFGRVDPREPPQPCAVRLAGYLTNVTATAVTCDNPAFAVLLDPAGRTLTVTPRLSEPGAQRGLARVSLSDPSQPSLALPLYAWTDDLLRLSPPALAFRPSAEPAPARLVIVRPGTAGRFAITNASVEGGSGAVRVLGRPDGNYQLLVENVIPSSLASNAALVIRTDLTNRPAWRVPLRLEGLAP